MIKSAAVLAVVVVLSLVLGVPFLLLGVGAAGVAIGAKGQKALGRGSTKRLYS